MQVIKTHCICQLQFCPSERKIVCVWLFMYSCVSVCVSVIVQVFGFFLSVVVCTCVQYV